MQERLIDGRHRVERLLGQGTSARTYQCADEAGVRVAIKELRVRGLDGWKPVELFEREARVLAELRHHGVPQVLGFFEARDADGDPITVLYDGRDPTRSCGVYTIGS